jgi:type I restriction enzyme M protein
VKFVLQKEGKKMGFSRSYRASLDRIESISIPKLPISIQNEFISKVEELLSKSEDLEKKLPILAEQQNIIIKQLLLDQ